MRKQILITLLVTSLVAGCSPATVSPTSLSTATFEPTMTPSPIPFETPMVTPYPGLQTQGPYLLFTRDNKNLTITDLGGKTTFIREESLYNQRWGEVGWLTETISLLDHPNDTDKPPIYDLVIVDTDTGQFKEIWPYSLETYAINSDNKTIVLIHKNHPTQKVTLPEGIYMVYPSGKYLKISDVGIYFTVMEGQKPYSIFTRDYNGQLYSVDDNGSINMLPWATDKIPLISPDGNSLLLRESQKLALYNNSFELLKSWQLKDDPYSLTWSRDSRGAFIFTSLHVYYLAILEEQPRLLEDCPLEKCEPVCFVWLP